MRVCINTDLLILLPSILVQGEKKYLTRTVEFYEQLIQKLY